MSDISTREYPCKQILELACAAQRVNGSYIKEGEAVYDEEGKFLFMKPSNKSMMLTTLDPLLYKGDPKEAPMPLKVLPEDAELAEQIQSHFRKLMFSAIEGENDFLVNINSILNSESVKLNQFGYVACLPSVFKRDFVQTKVKKAAKSVDEGFLADVDEWVRDLDVEIISSVKSKNFEGFNIDAIIDNKMVSWMAKTDLKLGPAVLVKGKVKAHNEHWKHKNDVTRLNYVKVAQ